MFVPGLAACLPSIIGAVAPPPALHYSPHLPCSPTEPDATALRLCQDWLIYSFSYCLTAPLPCLPHHATIPLPATRRAGHGGAPPVPGLATCCLSSNGVLLSPPALLCRAGHCGPAAVPGLASGRHHVCDGGGPPHRAAGVCGAGVKRGGRVGAARAQHRAAGAAVLSATLPYVPFLGGCSPSWGQIWWQSLCPWRTNIVLQVRRRLLL